MVTSMHVNKSVSYVWIQSVEVYVAKWELHLSFNFSAGSLICHQKCVPNKCNLLTVCLTYTSLQSCKSKLSLCGH